MQEQQQSSFALRDILTILFKHKWKILIVFVLGVIVTGIVAYIAPKQFVARSVIMVKFGREFTPPSEVGEGRQASPGAETIINTEMQILTSRDLILNVVSAIGPAKLYPDLAANPMPQEALNEAATMRFLQNVFVKDIKRSNLLDVYFRHDDPRVAAFALRVLIDKFKEKHLQVFSDTKTSFLEEQLKTYGSRLKESEGELSGFRRKNDVFSIDEQRSMLIKQRSELDFALQGEENKIKEFKEKQSFFKNQTGDIFTDSITTEMRSQLFTLQRNEQELSEKYTDSSKLLTTVRADIKLLKEQLKKREEELRSNSLKAVDGELGPLEVRVTHLRRQRDHIDGQLRALDSRSAQFGELRRETAANEINYQTYLKKLEEARISEDLDRRKMTNITVVQEASVPMVPMQTNRQKTIGIGLFLSLAVALGLAFGTEWLPQCLTTPQSAEKRLKLPILAAVALKK